MGQELSAERKKFHANLVFAAKERELGARKKFAVFGPVTEAAPSESAVDTRWAPAWKMVEGEKDVKARLMA